MKINLGEGGGGKVCARCNKGSMEVHRSSSWGFWQSTVQVEGKRASSSLYIAGQWLKPWGTAAERGGRRRLHNLFIIVINSVRDEIITSAWNGVCVCSTNRAGESCGEKEKKKQCCKWMENIIFLNFWRKIIINKTNGNFLYTLKCVFSNVILTRRR